MQKWQGKFDIIQSLFFYLVSWSLDFLFFYQFKKIKDEKSSTEKDLSDGEIRFSLSFLVKELLAIKGTGAIFNFTIFFKFVSSD